MPEPVLFQKLFPESRPGRTGNQEIIPARRIEAKYYSLKVVVAQGAVIGSTPQATLFEICGRSHKGRDRSCQVFRLVPLTRAPRGNRVSLGFRMGTPFGAYWCARKKGASS